MKLLRTLQQKSAGSLFNETDVKFGLDLRHCFLAAINLLPYNLVSKV